MIKEKLIVKAITATIALSGVGITIDSFNTNNLEQIQNNFRVVEETLKSNEIKLVQKYNELYEDASGSINQLEVEKLSVEEEYSKLDAINKNNSINIGNLKAKINELENQNKALQDEINQKGSRVEDEINKLKDENLRLQEEINKKSENNTVEDSSLNNELTSLKEELENKINTIKELELKIQNIESVNLETLQN